MRNKFIKHLMALLPALFLFALPLLAQAPDSLSSKTMLSGDNLFLLGIIAFVLGAAILALYFVLQLSKYKKEYTLRTGKEYKSGIRYWWEEMDKKFFTRAVPVEQEADVLLDHDYDGIKELDNALPPWWKWGFYFTVIVGVFYLLRFHVWNTGPSPEQEYAREMKIAEAKMANYNKNNKDAVDETTVTMADAKGIADGKKIFAGVCMACHGMSGEGNAVGPNLTDKYWLHGGSINDIFKTIKIGVPEKGMQAWGKTYSPTEIKNLSSYIMSLQGTNPPNAKAPQGNLYDAAKKTDSLAVPKKDSVSAAAGK